jgi:hypothetical protein
MASRHFGCVAGRKKCCVAIGRAALLPKLRSRGPVSSAEQPSQIDYGLRHYLIQARYGEATLRTNPAPPMTRAEGAIGDRRRVREKASFAESGVLAGDLREKLCDLLFDGKTSSSRFSACPAQPRLRVPWRLPQGRTRDCQPCQARRRFHNAVPDAPRRRCEEFMPIPRLAVLRVLHLEPRERQNGWIVGRVLPLGDDPFEILLADRREEIASALGHMPREENTTRFLWHYLSECSLPLAKREFAYVLAVHCQQIEGDEAERSASAHEVQKNGPAHFVELHDLPVEHGVVGVHFEGKLRREIIEAALGYVSKPA